MYLYISSVLIVSCADVGAEESSGGVYIVGAKIDGWYEDGFGL